MLSNLFNSYNFSSQETSIDSVALFKNTDSTQYYFVADYSEIDFLNYDDAKTSEDVINLYSNLKETDPTVVKNSALIILVKCAEYQPNQELLNKIYSIEEDPFGMRKYVIAAQSDIINQLELISLEELTKIVLNKDRFDRYQTYGRENSDHEYMGAIQIYIKLPFLKIEESRAQLQTITERAQALLQKDDNQHLHDQIIMHGKIFEDREKFLSNALSLEQNELDAWLDETLGMVNK